MASSYYDYFKTFMQKCSQSSSYSPCSYFLIQLTELIFIARLSGFLSMPYTYHSNILAYVAMTLKMATSIHPRTPENLDCRAGLKA
jgi:hypothetical protein